MRARVGKGKRSPKATPKKRAQARKRTKRMATDQTSATQATAKEEFSFVIRTCSKDMTSHGGFVWPTSGAVECLDWDPAPRCGNGLHGLVNGVGDYSHLSKHADAKWLVVKVRTADIVAIDKAKVKFPRGEVVYCGDIAGALNRIAQCWAALARAAAKGQYAAGSEEHAAAQGVACTAFAGFNGHAKASASSSFVIAFYDRAANRSRLVVGIPGENGILADTWYGLDEKGQLVANPGFSCGVCDQPKASA